MEDSLWRYVRDKLLPPEIHATRIESRTSVGFPDVHYTYQTVSGTLELKFLRKKKLPFGDEGLNQDQIIWHRQEEAVGGIHLIIAEVSPDIYIIPGRKFSTFNTMNDLEPASLCTFTKRQITQFDLNIFHGALERKFS